MEAVPAEERPSLLLNGRLLLADHASLQWSEIPAWVESAQFGDGRLMLLHPAFLRHREPICAAEQVDGLLLTLGKQGVQHGGQSFASEVGERETGLFGGGLGRVQA